MVDLRRLQFLREVAERRTIAAAADALGYTPSAISQQLSVLEQEIGTSLLERQGRSVVLTPAGRALVDESAAVFTAVQRASSAAEAAAGQLVGPVQVGAFQSVGATLVPAAFQALRTDNPDLEVHFRQWLSSGMRELRLGHLDICIDQEYSRLPHARHDGLDEHLLLIEPVYLAVRADADRGAGLARYDSETWVGADPDQECGRLMRTVCQEAGFEPEVRFHTEDLEVTLQIVVAGIGVAILPRLAAFRLPPEVVIHPVPGFERRVKALTRPGSADRPAVRVVLDALEKAGRELA